LGDFYLSLLSPFFEEIYTLYNYYLLCVPPQLKIKDKLKKDKDKEFFDTILVKNIALDQDPDFYRTYSFKDDGF